ncbi:hypothetical protein EYF80_027516 [Liparis tanakae]|uniref:Uncharacterized protein n=1 Tax=Liparis tanakae TaxID=230148 RepID=A0A4Z2HBU1_9TELE|nr:hypothetical protein EYF80_027516 [Liparis tanakae]
MEVVVDKVGRRGHTQVPAKSLKQQELHFDQILLVEDQVQAAHEAQRVQLLQFGNPCYSENDHVLPHGAALRPQGLCDQRSDCLNSKDPTGLLRSDVKNEGAGVSANLYHARARSNLDPAASAPLPLSGGSGCLAGCPARIDKLLFEA